MPSKPKTPSRALKLGSDGWLQVSRGRSDRPAGPASASPLWRLCPSPHADARPAQTTISLLVVHGISLPPGVFGGTEIEDLFMGRLLDGQSPHPALQSLAGLRVSSHFLIRRDGELLQFVSTLDRAWHAGVSSHLGRSACNDFSIGVELEGSDESAYEPAQMDCLVQLIEAAQQAHPTLTHLAGHCHISPGRKTDPGPWFDWAGLAETLQKAGLSLQLPQPCTGPYSGNTQGKEGQNPP